MGKYTSEFRTNLKLAYPVMLGQLGHVTVGLIDNIMIGRLGATDLAAVSAANSIFFIIFIFGLGVSTAITPLVAKADGEKDPKSIAKIFSNGIIVNTVMSILMYLIVSFGKPILYHLDQPVEVIDLAIPYLEIVTFSLIPVMIFQAFKQYSEGLSLTKPAMYATIIGNIVNVIFNYLLIFGKFGFPELGIVGAGIGTLISRFAMLLAMYLFVAKKRVFKSTLEYFKLKDFDYSVVKQIFKLGVPTGLQLVFEVGAFASAVFIAGLISTEAIAANQIAQSLISVSYMLATGFASAATVRVGNQIGKRDYRMLKNVGISNIYLVSILMGIFGLFFIFGNNLLPAMYIDDTQVITLTAGLLGIASIFQLSDGIQVVALGALRGLQDVKIPTFITFIAYWVIALPSSYVFAIIYDFGVNGIWMGLGIGLSFSGIFNLVRFIKISNELIISNK